MRRGSWKKIFLFPKQQIASAVVSCCVAAWAWVVAVAWPPFSAATGFALTQLGAAEPIGAAKSFKRTN